LLSSLKWLFLVHESEFLCFKCSYSQEADNIKNREIHNLGNLSKSSSVKEKEIYPNKDESPEHEETKQVLIVKPVTVMTINTSHVSEPTNVKTSIKIGRLRATKELRLTQIAITPYSL